MQAELDWLRDHPDFEERPATIEQFLGPEYLDIEKFVRQAVKEELVAIFGDVVDGSTMARYQLAMITGGIGIGKTTIASVVLPYLAHWVLCLKDPQGFFNMLPGSRIAFMQMSTSEKQGKEVVFGDIKARIEHSPWFQKKYPYDRDFKNQLRFSKDIWILPGDSAETTFEGYNILGGILDEADSHKITDVKDYAEQGYRTIYTRMTSRFEKRGFLLVIGQMKKANGFASKKYNEFKSNPEAYAVRMAIWDSMGWDHYLKPDGTRDSFWYDSKRHEIIPTGAARLMGQSGNGDNLIEVPEVFRRDFENNPEMALRDLAGIPPATGSPFISLAYKVEECSERWCARYNQGVEPTDPDYLTSPVTPKGIIEEWFKAQDQLKRAGHIDMAFSGDGDALGFAMGHVSGVVEIEGEMKPYIIIDMLMRIHAPAGREIFLGDIRRMVYDLKNRRRFNLRKVTMDGFQSTDTRQQFNKKRIISEHVSVDKDLTPYYDLREAIYEDRIDWPKYLIRLRPEDTSLTEIVVKELTELVDNSDKIDHTPDGSKDVADAVAGVTFTLMGERSYSRKVIRLDSVREERQAQAAGGSRAQHPAFLNGDGLRAPIPPTVGSIGGTPWSPPTRRR